MKEQLNREALNTTVKRALEIENLSFGDIYYLIVGDYAPISKFQGLDTLKLCGIDSEILDILIMR